MTYQSIDEVHLTTLHIEGPCKKLQEKRKTPREFSPDVLRSFPVALHRSMEVTTLAHDWLEDNIAVVMTGGLITSLLVIAGALGLSMRMASFY